MEKLIFLHAYASFTRQEENDVQNIVALEASNYARKPGRRHSIPKDSLSLNRLSYWIVIWIIIKWTINHFSLNRKGFGVRYRGLGSLPAPPEGKDTLAWASCTHSPPQENLKKLD